MEIKEGMYIRIIDPVRIICTGIGKVVKVAQDTIYAKVNNIELPIAFEKRHIVKASHNIIDLIEEGDYVNGVEVIYISYEKPYLEFAHNISPYDLGLKTYVGDNKLYGIKSILTKEQFKANEYVIEE